MAHVSEIIAAERTATRAFSALRNFHTEPTSSQSFDLALRILAEARHFAVCWAEQREREDSRIGRELTTAERIEAETQERDMRSAIIDRLVTSLVPSRM